jgi:hypothetical protein
MIQRYLWIVVASLLLAAPAGASSISVHFEHDGGGSAAIGPGGFFLDEVIDGVSWASTFSIATGAATAVLIDADGSVEYDFDDGRLTFDSGSTQIPLAAFAIRLGPSDQTPIWFNFGPGPVAQMLAYPDIDLLPGVLDPSIASALGVSIHTLGGSITLILDDFYGDAFSAVRDVTPNNVAGDLLLQTVPEPSTLLLMGAGLAVARRRSWRYARHGATRSPLP